MSTDRGYDWPLILAYHSVSEGRQDSLSVRSEDFARQMAWLRRRGYTSMSLADYMDPNVARPDRIVIITFDDGYADNYTVAFPILKRYGFFGTIFVVTDYVGRDHTYWWDEPKIKSPGEQSLYRILTWEQIHEMADHGFEFGSHTCTHPTKLTSLSHESCSDEILRSRADLGERLGREVVSFSYPRGDLSSEVLKLVETAGYGCAVVTPTRTGIPLGPYTLRRIGLYHDNTALQFRLKTLRLFRRNYEHLSGLRRRLTRRRSG